MDRRGGVARHYAQGAGARVVRAASAFSRARDRRRSRRWRACRGRAQRGMASARRVPVVRACKLTHYPLASEVRSAGLEPARPRHGSTGLKPAAFAFRHERVRQGAPPQQAGRFLFGSVPRAHCSPAQQMRQHGARVTGPESGGHESPGQTMPGPFEQCKHNRNHACIGTLLSDYASMEGLVPA